MHKNKRQPKIIRPVGLTISLTMSQNVSQNVIDGAICDVGDIESATDGVTDDATDGVIEII